MKASPKNIFLLEVIGTIMSIIIAGLVTLPFYLYDIDFPFVKSNFVMVFLSTMFIRWMFLTEHTFYSKRLLLHAILFVGCIFVIVTSYGVYGDFKFFYEEVDQYNLFSHLSLKDTLRIRNYMKTEFTFFAVLTMISAFVFGIHLIKSVFKIKNRKD